MRLIDADALKSALEIEQYNDYDDLLRTERLIDNAPTIKTFTLADIEEQYKNGLEKGLEEARPQGYDDGYKDGYKDGLKERNRESYNPCNNCQEYDCYGCTFKKEGEAE